MSILLPDSKIGQLLGSKGKLSHLLMGGSELCGQSLTPPRLFSEAVQNALLTMKELGLLLAAEHKGLWRGQDLEAWKGKMRVRNKVTSYLANRGNDVAQRA